MKKITSLLLGLILTIALSACADAPQNSDVQATDTRTSVVENVNTNNTEGQTDIPSQSDSTERISENSQTTETQNTQTTQNAQQNTQPSVQAHTHAYSKQITAPTCSAQGYTVYTCNCGHTYTSDYKSALNHTYTKTVTPATCSAQGYTTHTCSSCGHSYKDSYTTANHSYSSAVTPATCTAQGYTTHTCSVCGHNYKDNYTQATHSYVDYKCSTCGTVDKSHAYEYLMAWVKKNGKANGSNVDFSYWYEDDMFTISYNANYNYISVDKSTSVNGIFCYSYIALDTFYYALSLRDEFEVVGHLNATNFTDNTPISYENYSGSSAGKWDAIEAARLSCCELVDWLDWCLKYHNVGITIADLGFTSWVSQY